ncbi:MAG TPA: sigma 54-interacting transcriptional regulator [Kofleriaceae bacterium]
MRTWKAIPWIVAPAVLAITYAIAVVVAAWSAPQKGFLAFTGHRIAHVEVGGIADHAGLVAGDVIVAVDGTPVTSTFDYAKRVLGRAPGDVVALTTENHTVELELAASPPPWSALIATLLAAVLLALGVIARVGRPTDVLARKFYRASIVYAVVYVGSLSWPHLVIHPVLAVVFLGSLFVGPKLALDLALELTRARPSARWWSRATSVLSILLGATCAIGLAVAIRDYSTGGGDRGLRVMVAAIAIQVASVPLYTTIALVFQIREHRVAVGARRAQLRWLIFGQAVGVVPALAAIPAALGGLSWFLVGGYQPFVIAIAVIWFVSCGVAVLQVRLADTDALIESSLGYTITTGAAAVVYICVVLAAGWVTGWLVGDAGPWPHLVAGVTAAIIFGPLRARVGAWLDRRFFRDRHHYVVALRRAGESLAKLREPAELAREAVLQIIEAVRAERGTLYLRDVTGGWQLAYTSGRETDGDGLTVPVGAEPIAKLVLGPRKSGDLYSSQDRDMLAALAGQLAVAFANARAFGTIAELWRTLEAQAVVLQSQTTTLEQQKRELVAQNVEIQNLRERLEDENRLLRQRAEAATEGAKLVGDSRAIRELSRTVELVARSGSSVLLLGESGTGKGLLSRLVHAASSRADGPFMRVDLGAITSSVFEGELFGHERGAFTGATRMRRGPIELADGGTLVLDEIGELPLELQPKLLRVFEERAVIRVGSTTPVKVDVRIIAATNRNLEEMVERGEFREDLYFRLRVVEIVVPPLRDRLVDLPALCESLLPRAARRCGREVKPIANSALERMAAYAWPGNVRELQNVLERALVLGDGPEITAEELELSDRPLPPEMLEPRDPSTPHGAVMEDIERRRLTNALRDAAGNQSTAAKALGMPRTTFINKLRRYGLL